MEQRECPQHRDRSNGESALACKRERCGELIEAEGFDEMPVEAGDGGGFAIRRGWHECLVDGQ
ncbi:hypothetical protein M3I53_17930 [Paraburkholderia sp. CNPSo 3272]|uniref:hypothetical protein n=1 Tax=Paraburkholderia sp. CNPSo 3272 TaxID=2940931 RepID=UPI0020B76F74|nr:hypothetical protein [Paraburkholderia sp. CNPSo 3272]MCP3724980.1 hypothetical protein [Paraburkholderia sp. CNPSo 3272]